MNDMVKLLDCTYHYEGDWGCIQNEMILLYVTNFFDEYVNGGLITSILC